MKSHILWCVIDFTITVIDYQWLISKNKLPKVTILKVTCFWRVFQKSQLLKWLVFKRVTIFKRWLVLKKLPRVTNFNLSHKMIINIWPWHEFHNTTKTDSFHSKRLICFYDHKISFIKFLFNTFSSKKGSLFKHLCYSFSSFTSLSCQKIERTNRLRYLLFLTKDFKGLTAWDIFFPFPLYKRFQRTNRLRYLLYPPHREFKVLTA